MSPLRKLVQSGVLVLGAACAAGTAACSAGPCGEGTAAELRDCVQQGNYERDLVLASGERPPGSARWREVQDLCARRFEEHGYQVERHEYETGTNVVGVRKGSGRAGAVVVSAHYDSIPGCAGADDNASGVAALLESARVLAAAEHERDLVVACWDQEEDGLLGSKAWAQEAAARGEAIRMAFVYETMGFRSRDPDSQRIPRGLNLIFPEQTRWVADRQSRGDFIAVVADENADGPARSIERGGVGLDLPVLVLEIAENDTGSGMYGVLGRSDHASFWRAGFPAMMLTDTAEYRNGRYHCVDGADSPESLDHDFATRVTRLTVAAAAEELDAP